MSATSEFNKAIEEFKDGVKNECMQLKSELALLKKENKSLHIENKSLKKDLVRIKGELTLSYKRNDGLIGSESIKNLPINDVGLSTGTVNCLIERGYETIRDISSVEITDLMKIPRLGYKRIHEIDELLKIFGLSFNGDHYNYNR